VVVVVGDSVVVVVEILTGFVDVVVVGGSVVVVVVGNPVGNDIGSLGVTIAGVGTTSPLLAVVVVVVDVLLVVAGTVVVVDGATRPSDAGYFSDVVVVTGARGGCDSEVGPPPRYRTIAEPVKTTTIATANVSHGVHPAGLARFTMRDRGLPRVRRCRQSYAYPRSPPVGAPWHRSA
jgi:hypothetical protein